jgi:hypothetical protein
MAAKDLALRTANQGKQALLDRWQALREKSPYFQAKVGLVGAWLVVALLTILIAPPSPIEFIVEQKTISFGLAEKTNLVIFNQGGGDLDKAVVIVEGVQTDFDGKKASGSWRTKPIAVPQGLKTTLSTESFFDDKGANPGYQLQITDVVNDDDGDVVFRGPPGAKKK